LKPAALDTAELLRLAAIERGLFVSGDGRVSECDAAGLLGYSAEHFAELRRVGTGPPAFRLGLRGARFSYRLADIASWIETRRDDGV
jgi:hypothetical protein